MRVIDGADVSTRECPSCSCDVPARPPACPICGYLFPVATSRQKHLRLWGSLIMLGLIAFLYLWRYL